MADNTLDVRIKQKYDTEANWNSKNPVLLEGEVGYIPDGRFKVGNGTSTWSQLSYNKANTANSATTATQLTTSAGSATQPVYFSDGKPVVTTYSLGKSVPSNAVFTDTHYASKNVVGSSTATSNTTSSLTNGNVYLNSVENGAVTSSHKISGSNASTVTTDANGNIIVSSSDTKNTTGSTDTSSKIFLVGATSQAANPQTYSDNQVYVTNGQLDSNKVRVAEKVTLQFDTATESLNFIFS